MQENISLKTAYSDYITTCETYNCYRERAQLVGIIMPEIVTEPLGYFNNFTLGPVDAIEYVTNNLIETIDFFKMHYQL